MLDPLLIFILGFVIVYFAGVTQGLTGFGFGMVSAPLLLIFLSPSLVVPIIVVSAVLLCIIVVYESRKWIDIKRIMPLLAAGITGIPFGTYILVFLEPALLKLFVGSVVVIFGIAFLTGFRREVRRESAASAPVGFISGLLGGSTSMSGPPVVLFFTNQGIDKKVFRANIITYFLLLNSVISVAYVFGGIITREVVLYVSIFIPAIVLGTLTGIKLVNRVNEVLFKRLALIIVIVSGIVSMLSVL